MYVCVRYIFFERYFGSFVPVWQPQLSHSFSVFFLSIQTREKFRKAIANQLQLFLFFSLLPIDKARIKQHPDTVGRLTFTHTHTTQPYTVRQSIQYLSKKKFCKKILNTLSYLGHDSNQPNKKKESQTDGPQLPHRN